MVKNLDDDAWSSTHIWYDQLGRAIGSQGKNHLGGYTKTEKQLDFSGAVLFANTFHKRTNLDPSEVVINEDLFMTIISDSNSIITRSTTMPKNFFHITPITNWDTSPTKK